MTKLLWLIVLGLLLVQKEPLEPTCETDTECELYGETFK